MFSNQAAPVVAPGTYVSIPKHKRPILGRHHRINTMHPIRLLLRLRCALGAAWVAGVRTWKVAGEIDGRLRRHQMRLAMLDADDLNRLYHADQFDACRQDLKRSGLLR